MKATEELRRMLDERGVEWQDGSDENVLHTTWNDMNCWFNEFPDGWTAWGMAKRGTPEQAIAATLGSGTTTMTTDAGSQNWYSCDACDADGYAAAVPNYCPNCGAKVVNNED